MMSLVQATSEVFAPSCSVCGKPKRERVPGKPSVLHSFCRDCTGKLPANLAKSLKRAKGYASAHSNAKTWLLRAKGAKASGK